METQPNLNYLMSLRNDTGDGTPGSDLGETTYVSIGEGRDDYKFNDDDKMVPSEWFQNVQREAGGGPIIVFVHGGLNVSR